LSSDQKGKSILFIQTVENPQELSLSLKGNYFDGFADELKFGIGISV